MSRPCERALCTSLYSWLGLWFAVLAEVMLVLDTYSYSMLPISPPRRTKSLRSLGGSSAHLLDEMTPAVTSSANHGTFSLRNPLWNDLDFVPGCVKPRPTCSSYPVRSPPRVSRLGPESISRSCRLLPDFVHAHDRHRGDCDIQAIFRPLVDNQNDYPKGSTTNIDVDNTTIPSSRQERSR